MNPGAQGDMRNCLQLANQLLPPSPSTSAGASVSPRPQRLLLAEHIGTEEDPLDVKEDFLATPLPFVGAVM